MITVDVPVVREKDVLVIGGGCAGIGAAISAARGGASVLLAEHNGCLGGMATSGLVGPFMTCYDPTGQRQVIKGIYEEFVQRMVERGDAVHPAQVEPGCSYTAYRVAGHAHCAPFDAEGFKVVAETMCQESGVELLYHATFVSAVMDSTESRILGAIFATKAGLIQINASVIIDCTGDGDVAKRSGAPMVYGDENRVTQPASMFFVIRGVDKKELEQVWEKSGDISSLYFQNLLNAEIEAGRYSVPRNKVALYENPDGTFRVNMSRVFLKDGCDPFEVTQAAITGRKQIEEIISMLRRLIPGCQNVQLVESAAMLGQRESRRIVGDFVLTGAQIAAKEQFDDVIFLSGNSMDMHGGNQVNYQPATGAAYQIPYRILLPKKVKNLLVAGRCASLDREALAAIRVMPPVFAMGQAAGTAAALCIKDRVTPAHVDVRKMQDCLLQGGAVLA